MESVILCQDPEREKQIQSDLTRSKCERVFVYSLIYNSFR